MSQFGKTLMIASALHVGACVWLARVPRRITVITQTVVAPELLIEPDAAALAEQVAFPSITNPLLSGESRGTKARSTRAPSPPPNASAATVSAAPESGAFEVPGQEPTPSPAGNDTVPIARTPTATPGHIDLGLDGRLLMPGPAEVGSLRNGKRALARDLERSLNSSLAQDDVARGLAKGGLLVGPLNAAVRVVGPSSGEASIRVTFDAAGEVRELELLRGAMPDWSNALRAFRAEAKRRRVRVPDGANGLRVTLDVSVKTQRPSGTETGTSSLKLKRPSLAPDGLTFRGGFDVADLSGKSERVATSRVVAEEVL
jgi:hypothetical protein